MKEILIYGNGKIARILYHFIKKKYKVSAFTVDENFIKTTYLEGLPLVPFKNIEKTHPKSEFDMIIGVGYAQMNNIREAKYLAAKEKGYEFINYIHPSVEIHENINIGENNIILDNVSIQPFSQIGNSNFLWSNAVLAHGCILGDTNWITSGVVVSGDSIIGSRCFLGVNATIGHSITIKNENFIGANTLITRNTNEKEVFISKEGEKFRLDSQRFLKFSEV